MFRRCRKSNIWSHATTSTNTTHTSGRSPDDLIQNYRAVDRFDEGESGHDQALISKHRACMPVAESASPIKQHELALDSRSCVGAEKRSRLATDQDSGRAPGGNTFGHDFRAQSASRSQGPQDRKSTRLNSSHMS